MSSGQNYQIIVRLSQLCYIYVKACFLQTVIWINKFFILEVWAGNNNCSFHILPFIFCFKYFMYYCTLLAGIHHAAYLVLVMFLLSILFRRKSNMWRPNVSPII